MGAKSSKSELSRKKSFTNIGRSSQRSLFQKSKIKLNGISRQIDKTNNASNVTTLDRIKSDLDAVDKELNGISEAVKVKNQEKYDEICKSLQTTRKKYDDKFPLQIEELHEQLSVKTVENEPAEESIVLRNTNGNTNRDIISYAEEPKRPGISIEEKSEDVKYPEELKRPSVKFGVQVLPPSPQISQVLLKRKTYPINSTTQSEVVNVRNTTDGGFTQTQNGVTKVTTIQTSNSFNTNNVTESISYRSVSRQISKPDYIKSNSILGIESINNEINELEAKLKYFTGNKASKNYMELHEGFLNNLALLDSVETDEDPITKQEKRILGQRITELLKILECLVEPIIGECDDQILPPTRNSERFENTAILLSAGTEI